MGRRRNREKIKIAPENKPNKFKQKLKFFYIILYKIYYKKRHNNLNLDKLKPRRKQHLNSNKIYYKIQIKKSFLL